MEQDNQQQFISWLAQKLGAKDEGDLKSKIQQMGQDGIKQAYNAFLQEQNQQVPAQQLGGKLEYLRCLKAFKKGGAMEMEKCGCAKMQKGGKMDEDGMDDGIQQMRAAKGATKTKGKQFISRQAGGPMEFSVKDSDPAKIMQVQKADGSVGGWGNAVPTTQNMYALHNAQPVSEQQITHLRNNAPDFAKVGQPMQVPGQMPRYSPDQSDMIQSLMKQYPLTQPNSQSLALHAKGGSMLGKKDYLRKESNVKDMGMSGTRNDEQKVWQGMGDVKDGKATPWGKQGTRKEAATKEANPGKKDWMSKGGKKEHTALTKVPKGSEGMVTPKQKKMIMLKEQDAKKGQAGMKMQSPEANEGEPMLQPRKRKK